jgi:Flp pilus assembly protein TadG
MARHSFVRPTGNRASGLGEELAERTLPMIFAKDPPGTTPTLSKTSRPNPSSACRRGRRPAATAMEFAVVAPIFFLLILGFIELGRGLMVQHLMTNAARRGCRVAVIEGKNTNDVNAAVIAALTGQGIRGDTVAVQVNDSAKDASSASVGDEITVVVSVPTASVSWVPKAGFLFGTISGRYTLRRE